jgi:ribosomal protein S18 acetylase RimI-like enzyme
VNRAASTAVTVERLEPTHAAQTVAMLEALRVSLFGIQSRRLHDTLVGDGVARRIDCRIAVAAGEVCGVVMAAPRAYWTSALLTHWSMAFECVRARLSSRQHPQAPDSAPAIAQPAAPSLAYDAGSPRRTWRDPGDAWRIIVVGTAPAARGRGVGAELYRAMMRDRSLVARIAPDNHASIRLHRSVGWRLYPDGEVVLAVHERGPAP